jgi:hypothetical protein
LAAKQQVLGEKYGNCWLKFFFCELAIKLMKFCENSSFLRSKYRHNLQPKPLVHSPFWAICCIYSPCLLSQANVPQGTFLGGKIAAKITQKTKFLEEIAAKIVLFEKIFF